MIIPYSLHTFSGASIVSILTTTLYICFYFSKFRVLAPLYSPLYLLLNSYISLLKKITCHRCSYWQKFSFPFLISYVLFYTHPGIYIFTIAINLLTIYFPSTRFFISIPLYGYPIFINPLFPPQPLRAPTILCVIFYFFLVLHFLYFSINYLSSLQLQTNLPYSTLSSTYEHTVLQFL